MQVIHLELYSQLAKQDLKVLVHVQFQEDFQGCNEFAKKIYTWEIMNVEAYDQEGKQYLITAQDYDEWQEEIEKAIEKVEIQL